MMDTAYIESLMNLKGTKGWKRNMILNTMNRFNYLIENHKETNFKNFVLWTAFILMNGLKIGTVKIANLLHL